MLFEKKKLFNPTGNDDVQNRSIIGGNATGLFNLNNVKYSWAKSLYQVMIGNFWIPEKISGLWEDGTQYQHSLTTGERRAYRGILSFLIFLDSIQTRNLPNFSDFITAPEVNILLAIQTFQEAIHSQSYATILETVVDSKERDEIYYFWRDDALLLERNAFIGGIYEDFRDEPNEANFFRALVANFLLESIYFYNGFAFFDSLVDNSKMLSTGRMINYIRRDELTHVTLFSNIFREIKKEFPHIYNEEIVRNMMSTAVEQEITWSKHIIANSVTGMTDANIEWYTKWLANQRLSLLGMKPLYLDAVSNPMKHLDRLQDNNGDRANFFESTVTNYTQSNSLNGSWDF